MGVLTNKEIKFVKSLAQKKFRDSTGLFTVEGEKLVDEALASGLEVLDVYRTSEIGQETMSRISALTSPSPVLAVVRRPEQQMPEIEKGKLYLALDSVRDPGNLGTIIRIADWFGIEAIFASQDTVELYNPKVIQATMGAIFRKKVIYCNLSDVCSSFAQAGMNIYGTFLDGTDIYHEELDTDGLIVMGNEANGISREIGGKVSRRLLIPSFAKGPGAESLNVAIATAITVSEFRRR